MWGPRGFRFRSAEVPIFAYRVGATRGTKSKSSTTKTPKKWADQGNSLPRSATSGLVGWSTRSGGGFEAIETLIRVSFWILGCGHGYKFGRLQRILWGIRGYAEMVGGGFGGLQHAWKGEKAGFDSGKVSFFLYTFRLLVCKWIFLTFCPTTLCVAMTLLGYWGSYGRGTKEDQLGGD